MYQTNSPVLLIVFNRPDQTRAVFEMVRKVRPSRLYLAADAPRPQKKGEETKCKETLAVFDEIDWPCEVFRKVNQVNMGSHTSIPAAVDWFFENEEAGIVLEDDCVPSEGFFIFCDQLLARYANDERIMWINGSNLGYLGDELNSDYVFSIYPISWGWASWRRAWSLFDRNYRVSLVDGISEDALRHNAGHSWMARLYWRFIFEYAYAIKNWDYRWMHVCWANNGLACTPSVNMVSNVGFGPGGMHCERRDDRRGFIPAKEISGTIKGPERLVPSAVLDRHLDLTLYEISAFSVLRALIASRFPKLRNFARKIQDKPI